MPAPTHGSNFQALVQQRAVAVDNDNDNDDWQGDAWQLAEVSNHEDAFVLSKDGKLYVATPVSGEAIIRLAREHHS